MGTAKKYELTDEHRAQLKPWADKWIANALNTNPMDDADRETMRAAVRGLYEAAGLKPPGRIVFCASPIGGAIAASIASGVWWLRKNPGKHRELVGADLSEADLRAGLEAAVAFAVRNGMHRTLTLKSLPPSVPRLAATGAATEAATGAATRAATGAATWAATGAATEAATGAATRAATGAATEAATGAATGAATWDATGAATEAATWDATEAATEAATRAATGAATEAATGAATRAATGAATWDATGAATEAATEAATGAATRAATGAATWAATWDATGAATWDATGAATGAATEAAIQEARTAGGAHQEVERSAPPAVRALARFLIGCCDYWGSYYNGGNQWSGWSAYLSFFRHVAKLQLPIYEKFQHYEAAAIHGGPRFMHEEFCIVSDRPTVVARDEQNRPHREDGPFTAWRDGWALYAWHGVRVPAHVIEAPETITVAEIEAEENAEVRRVMVTRYGQARYLRDAGAKEVQRDEFGVLYRKELPGDEPIVMVRVLNSTPEPDGSLTTNEARAQLGAAAVDRACRMARLNGHAAEARWKDYFLRVSPELRPLMPDGTMGEPQELTAHNAVASTFGLRGEDYWPEIET